MKSEKEVSKGKSYFTMEAIKEVSTMTDVDEAKKLAMQIVYGSGARTPNKKRAAAVVLGKYDVAGITIAMTNFFLAHPSENLSVNRAALN